MNKLKPLLGFLSFGLAVVAIVAALKILNWFPLAVQQNMLREYSGIEQVKSALQIQDIYVPSYFPESISWPPSKILAQERPFPALLMEFTSTGTGQIVLVLSQSKGGPIRSDRSLEPASVRESVPFVLHGVQALLTVGECKDRDVCSVITWDENGYTISASMKAAPFQLTKIAESMRRGHAP
jgi:hypothetical protein